MKIPLPVYLLIFVCSCSGYEYVPNPHYVPLNNQKNDVKVSIGNFNYQVGYFLTDHITVFSTGFYRNTIGSSNWDEVFENHYVENTGTNHREDENYTVNLGCGYMTKFGPGILGILGSAGFGNMYYAHTKDLVNDFKFKQYGNNYNIYIQPIIGVNVKNYFEFGFSPKFVRMSYFNLRSTMEMGDNTDDISKDLRLAGRKNANLYFFEPGLIIRAGGKNYKAEVQFVPTNISEDTKKMRYRDFTFFLSFHFNLKYE